MFDQIDLCCLWRASLLMWSRGSGTPGLPREGRMALALARDKPRAARVVRDAFYGGQPSGLWGNPLEPDVAGRLLITHRRSNVAGARAARCYAPGRAARFLREQMPFRPTLIERAYSLAVTGIYANPSEVKKALALEGYTGLEIQTQLHGSTITTALMKRCKDSYRAPPVE